MIKVLVVEDELIVVADVVRILETSGYEVVGTATRPEEGIRKATESRPQIVLMDLSLKNGTSGLEAAEYIEKVLKIPVILLTGQSSNSALSLLKPRDPCGFVMKPFTDTHLVSCVTNVAKYYGLLD